MTLTLHRRFALVIMALGVVIAISGMAVSTSPQPMLTILTFGGIVSFIGAVLMAFEGTIKVKAKEG